MARERDAAGMRERECADEGDDSIFGTMKIFEF